MYRDPVPKNSWVFLTVGKGGQGPPCRNAYGHIIDLSDLEKMYCRCLNFDSLALGFYPDAGFF